ncbi:hypothetical protein NUU61_009497 [Penicillium alfredii]|uniref:Zn(2)-C6 fungal-type domain-containing protein n=1 Tax=Penicillium alfredii TaxID=1506179 RepID=A0A9W9EN63_9EURO|nr:uncharacterized protein NUU61_009497 [Penicillium alfredii]KAJ5084918.1 hypothetical protein NUU61_009497 [Penicillium alfredii]
MSPSNDNYAIHKVALKRTRQACGPCRRKKARCPGEKPACSLCQRLGQRCVYGPQAASARIRHTRMSSSLSQDRVQGEMDETPEISNSQRFQRIEDRLEKMACILQESLPKVNPLADVPSRTIQPRRNSEHRHSCSTQESRGTFGVQGHHEEDSLWSSFPADFLQSQVEIYLTYFHDQPYCVFPRDWLLNHAGSLPPEIAFPLVALTSRVPHRSHEAFGDNARATKYCAQKAWAVLSGQYKDCRVGLSFLQGAFLMAQVNFADGQAHRAYASVALGIRTLQSAGLNKDKYASSVPSSEIEKRRRIAWAFFMLDRTYNASRNYSLCLADKHFTLSFPSAGTEGPHQENDPLFHGTLRDGPEKKGQNVDHGILACLLRLYSLWGKATEYVFEPFDENDLPPWQTGSALAILESEWLQFETRFADTHRYINVDFKRRAREEPESRAYLSTWMCVQFLFHSIQCLLHHPFVIMIKLRQMNGNLSATFLQKSFENSLLHSRWIARFIREMSEVDFGLYDPFLGYLAAIAATIQLEHTGSKNPQIALLVNREFQTLVDFITELSVHWENMRGLVNKLNELASRHQNYGSLYYNQDGYSGALSSMPTSSNIPRMSAEDEALTWDILDMGSSTSQLGDLIPNHDQEIGTGSPRFSDHSLAPISQGPIPHDISPLHGSVQEPISHDSISVWPFSNGNGCDALGAAMPDIPDWLMLEDYMAEHL